MTISYDEKNRRLFKMRDASAKARRQARDKEHSLHNACGPSSEAKPRYEKSILIENALKEASDWIFEDQRKRNAEE